jgi:murein L,D-transpeptidase YcbB/YkuD
MPASYNAALALIVTASFSLPGFAAETDRSASLTTQGESIRISVEDRLSSRSSSSSVRKAERDALVKFFAVVDQGLLWVDENGVNQRGKAAITEIKKADDYGLRASDYDVPNPDEFDAKSAKTSDWLADAEIKISFAVLDYARDARGGRIDPQRLSVNLDPTLALPDPSEVIQSIASSTDPATYLQSFQPHQPQFEMLRRKLAELRGGDSEKTSASTDKISAILVNMERWRWLPNDLGPYYVNVNVPEFMLSVVDEGKVIHTARVVVGKPDKQTPIFSKDMQEIIFNPVWSVPNSIKTEEILPYLTSGGGLFGGGYDTHIFRRHGLHVKYGGREVDPDSIDWHSIDIRNVQVYQPPGPDNVLGHVKFVFPNKYDVYLHDTTMKNYYGQSFRAESHGCMRVQNPDELALVLLKHDQGWTRERVASAIHGSGDNHVVLQQKIPVYISYFTVKVNDDGSISTFKDIYGYDSRMMAALNRKHLGVNASTNDNKIATDQVKQSGKRVRQGGNPTNNFPFQF